MQRRWKLGVIAITCIASTIVVGLIAYVQWSPINLIKPSVQAVEPAPVALILGASIKNDGTPSDALNDRILTGVDLYQAGKVKKLLMTGDDGKFRRDEVDVMKKTAVADGVPESDVLIDGEGYRTYESCKRATEVYGIKKAVIVTQRFHLSRALYLCSHFGMDVQGIAADRQSYLRIVYFTIRDLLASVKAWWDINVVAPESPVKPV